MSEPCVCTHAEDEHMPQWGCVAEERGASGYPPDELLGLLEAAKLAIYKRMRD